MKRKLSVTEKGKGGLSQNQAESILVALKQAKARGGLPPLSYEYNPHSRLFGRDPLYVWPKSGGAARVGVKIRNIIRGKFGGKYSVRLV